MVVFRDADSVLQEWSVSRSPTHNIVRVILCFRDNPNHNESLWIATMVLASDIIT